jgi:O-antigen ligase
VAHARTTNPHSLELQTFAELGVLGLAALGVFFVDVLRRRRGLAVAAGALAIGLAALIRAVTA